VNLIWEGEQKGKRKVKGKGKGRDHPKLVSNLGTTRACDWAPDMTSPDLSFLFCVMPPGIHVLICPLLC
jgi:hypothetical protein